MVLMAGAVSTRPLAMVALVPLSVQVISAAALD